MSAITGERKGSFIIPKPAVSDRSDRSDWDHSESFSIPSHATFNDCSQTG